MENKTDSSSAPCGLRGHQFCRWLLETMLWGRGGAGTGPQLCSGPGEARRRRQERLPGGGTLWTCGGSRGRGGEGLWVVQRAQGPWQDVACRRGCWIADGKGTPGRDSVCGRGEWTKAFESPPFSSLHSPVFPARSPRQGHPLSLPAAAPCPHCPVPSPALCYRPGPGPAPLWSLTVGHQVPPTKD